jgi:hypothetical protein
MEDNVSKYTQISLQDFVANIVKQTQDDLAQFRREFQEEGMSISATICTLLEPG